MAKFALQLQMIVVVLTFFLIVIEHYVWGTREPLPIYRGDYDTFKIPVFNNNSYCSARNANCTNATALECSECTCMGQYKTYFRDRCVKDDTLLDFIEVEDNWFMIKNKEIPNICITYDGQHNITAASCNLSDFFQRWIWTRHGQLYHVKTLKCVQQGSVMSHDKTWYLDLKECNNTEKKQKWDCDAPYSLRQLTSLSTNQKRYILITFKTGTILAQVHTGSKWIREYQSNANAIDNVCSLSFGCSAMVVLDSKCRRIGEQQINIIKHHGQTKQCSVTRTVTSIEFLNYDSWKHLKSRENIFKISNTGFLKWNFTMVPSNWANKIIKLNFVCTPEVKARSRCFMIKLIKVSHADCPRTTPTTVPSSEKKSPTKSPSLLRTTLATTAESTVITPYATSDEKLPTSLKEQQKGESSSSVGIIVGVLVAILVLCGILLGIFCYKRRKSFSRSGKNSSNVEINGKSSGDTLNPIYSSGDNKNISLSNDGGVYQEPDGNYTNASSQACSLYESADNHEHDYATVDEKNKPAPTSEELEYDYAENDNIRSSVQGLPVGSKNYRDTVIKNKNAVTDVNEDKETGNDAGPLYQTLEDDTAPVYQTLESE